MIILVIERPHPRKHDRSNVGMATELKKELEGGSENSYEYAGSDLVG